MGPFLHTAKFQFLIGWFRRKRRGTVIALASAAAAEAEASLSSCENLTFSYTSVITEDIYLKLTIKRGTLTSKDGNHQFL